MNRLEYSSIFSKFTRLSLGPLPAFMSRAIVIFRRNMTEEDTWWMDCNFAQVGNGQGHCQAPRIQLIAIAVLRYSMLVS